MTLRPNQLAGMKLGVHKDWTPISQVPAKPLPMAELAPAAYGRNYFTRRIKGFNDLYGDCVPVACCNVVQTLLGRRGVWAPINGQVPLDIYSVVTGFNKADPTTDNGTDPNQMLAWWKVNSIEGYRLNSFSLINPKDDITYHAAIARRGAVLAIVNLAVEQQNQLMWSAAGTPGTWGMHCICLDQYVGPAGSTSWGEEKWIDRSFFDNGFVVQIYELEVIEA